MRAFFLLLIAVGISAQTQKLTLQEAIDLALKNNPRVDAARLNALATAQTTTQARSAYYPQVAGLLTGAGAPLHTNMGAGTLQAPGVESRLGIGTSVSQLITDFGRTDRLVKSAEARTQADQQVARGSRAEIVLQTTQAYLAALRADAVTRVAEQTVKARGTVLEQIQALATNQLKSELDVRFAEVAVTEAELVLTSARNDRNAAEADLAAALGLQGPQHFELTNIAMASDITGDRGELIKQAVQQNPEAEQRRYILDAALRQAEAEAKLRYPTISAVGAAGVVPAHSSVLTRDNYIAGGVNISVPIFTGKLISSRRSEAEYRAESAKRVLKDTENRVARNVAVTLLNIGTAGERVKLTTALVDRARQALELSQLRYDLGLSSIVELTQAQLAQVNAEIQRATSEYDLDLQRAVLDFHIGTTP